MNNRLGQVLTRYNNAVAARAAAEANYRTVSAEAYNLAKQAATNNNMNRTAQRAQQALAEWTVRA